MQSATRRFLLHELHYFVRIFSTCGLNTPYSYQMNVYSVMRRSHSITGMPWQLSKRPRYSKMSKSFWSVPFLIVLISQLIYAKNARLQKEFVTKKNLFEYTNERNCPLVTTVCVWNGWSHDYYIFFRFCSALFLAKIIVDALISIFIISQNKPLSVRLQYLEMNSGVCFVIISV